ncbi:MAG: UTP--glucose-1-phosphate uridylyltransferase GalU [Acidobacteriia bacterium]|nr:UTP--glucose-1-phosphate uridylyltransferase GalU [Terriglobia bacterium]
MTKPENRNHLKIRKAVFPAAGLGTRFLPATKAQPKEMLPLVDKPIIQYVIEEAVLSGLQNIIIVTGRGKNAIEDHFDVSYELEKILEARGKTDLVEQVRSVSELIHVSYVRQKEALGLGHAILMTRELVGNEPFAVFLGDDIIESDIACMKQMMAVYDRYHCAVVALEEVSKDDISRYGVIEGNAVGSDALGKRIFKIENMVEKPPREQAPSNLAIIGRYILTPEIFDCLEQTRAGAGGEIQLTDGLKGLLNIQPIYGYQFEGKRHDAGDKLGFLKATVELALKRADLGQPFREYLKSLHL